MKVGRGWWREDRLSNDQQFVVGLGRYRTAEVLSIHLTDVRPPRPRDRDGWYNKIVIDAVILIWPEMTSDNYRSRNGNDRETS